MCRLLVLALLGLARCCGGFVVSSNARRWSGNVGVATIADADRPRGVPSQQRHGVVRMSVKDMIGADVETGGLFDPLGEVLRRRKDCSGTLCCHEWDVECGLFGSLEGRVLRHRRFPPRKMTYFISEQRIQTFNRSACRRYDIPRVT